MSVEYCVLDGDPANGIAPRNPTVDDMGGAQFVDDDVYPPKENEQVTCGDINQMEKLLVRACRMMPAASFWVRKTGANATLLGFKSQSDSLAISDVVVAGSGTDVFSIRIPLGRIRQGVVPPTAQLVATGDYAAQDALIVSQEVTSTYCYIWVRGTTNFTARVDTDGEGEFTD